MTLPPYPLHHCKYTAILRLCDSPKVTVITEKLDVENLAQVTVNSNKKEQRGKLFNYLDDVIAVSQKKFKMEKASNDDRQAWGRIIITAVQAYGKILNDEDLEEVKQRLEALEKAVDK